jgi:hypothetical protein
MSSERSAVRKLTLAALCVAAAVPFLPVALATTLPTKSVLIDVVYVPTHMVVAQYQGVTLGNGTPGFNSFVGTIPRGSYLKFIVINRSNKVHQFTAFGKTTMKIKPGAKTMFNKYAKTRGKFPYRDLLQRGKTYHGAFVIA